MTPQAISLLPALKFDQKPSGLQCRGGPTLGACTIHTQTQQFLEATIEHNLIPTITKLTRVTYNSATLIDNIFLKSEMHETHQSKIVIDNISDHYPSLLVLENLNLAKITPHKLKRRKIGNKEIFQIKSKLSSIDWETELSNQCTNDSFDYFHNNLMQIIDMVASERIVTEKKKGPSVPWYTPGLKKCTEKDKRLYKQSKSPTARADQKLKYQE